MLPSKLRPLGFNSWDKESWDEFRTRIDVPEDEATLQFFRQVVYDHFDHFNEHYPDFKLEDYEIGFEWMSAQDAYDQIRFFLNKPMVEWGTQYDEFKKRNQDYSIFVAMTRDRTPPFPPVLIESRMLVDTGAWRIYGRELHLIEGTHRVSYLRRMMELGEVLPESTHKFVVLRPRH